MSKKPFEYNLKEIEEREGDLLQSAESYNLDHGDISDADMHAADFEYYDLDDDDRTEEADEDASETASEETAEAGHPRPLTLLLYMMTNPVEGWKRIRRAGLTPEETAAKCFYPLAALASLSVFAEMLYGTLTGITTAVIKGLLVFISFFLGYFLIKILTKVFTPKSCRRTLDSDYGKEYAMYLLSTLALFYTAGSLLPMLDSLLVFLPLWTIYLATKGMRFFKFSDSRTTLITVLICSYIILSPIAVYSLFADILMP